MNHGLNKGPLHPQKNPNPNNVFHLSKIYEVDIIVINMDLSDCLKI